jgi:hypothetical protein
MPIRHVAGNVVWTVHGTVWALYRVQGTDTVENVQLVASELVGNAVRAYGDLVPLVVEVETDDAEAGVWVKVHDPDPVRRPRRSRVAMDDAEAVCGRGLSLIDFLAPGWDVSVTPIGKQVRACLPYTASG